MTINDETQPFVQSNLSNGPKLGRFKPDPIWLLPPLAIKEVDLSFRRCSSVVILLL